MTCRTCIALIGAVVLGCSYTGAAAETEEIGHGPHRLESGGVVLALDGGYQVPGQWTQLCLDVDQSRYALDDFAGWTVRPLAPGEPRPTQPRLDTLSALDSTRIAISGHAVTADGTVLELERAGYSLGVVQGVCLGLPETPPGTKLTELRLASSRPLTVDAIRWHVIVR